MILKRLLYICIALISTLSFAQTEIAIQADTNLAWIGDVINISLKVETNEKIIWPELEEAIAPLELQKVNSIDSSFVRGKEVYSQNFTVQQFDTGRFVLPNLPFITTSGDTFYSDSLTFAFIAVPLDTTNAVFDIKTPVAVPFNFEEAKPYIYGFIGLIALIILLYYLIQKINKRDKTIEEVIELIPCEIEAMDALKNLEADGLCDKGLVKEHYVRLTEILRNYFDRQYTIDTLESTTDETIDLLKASKVDKGIIEKVSTLLVEADLVKFAKSNPDHRINASFMTHSYDIVNDCHQMKKEEEDA
jgi:hypothetical protein